MMGVGGSLAHLPSSMIVKLVDRVDGTSCSESAEDTVTEMVISILASTLQSSFTSIVKQFRGLVTGLRVMLFESTL